MGKGDGAMLATGDRIGRYVIEEHVGSGRTADVYAAHDPVLDRRVALKMMHGSGARGRREADAVASLQHRHIAALYDVIEIRGALCLAYEWMPGGSLAARLESEGALAADEVARLLREIGSALDYAHGRGVLHRDIKPSNILRDSDGSYKLVDFGALGVLDDTGMTRSGQIAGTPIYMSPEQLSGARQTAASDLFGLGVVAFESLHGRPPGGGSASYLELATSRIYTPIAVPASPLQRLLEHLLELDPGKRPQSAREAMELLPVGLAGPTPPPAPPSAEMASAPAPQSHPPPGDGADNWVVGADPGALPVDGPEPVARGPRRQRHILVAFAIGGALVALVATLLMLGDGSPSFGDTSTTWAIEASGLLRVVAGAAIALVAIGLSRRVRARWPDQSVERRAQDLVFGATNRAEISQSLVVEVDEIVAGLRAVDARVLGVTIVAMLHEYEDGESSSDRQAALLNVVALLEKVTTRLSPWHLRHKESIGLAIAVIGCLAGTASAISGLLAR